MADSKRNEMSNGINIVGWERWASLCGGGALATYGLLRRDKVGAALAVFGAGLIQRSAMGHCYLYQALGVSTAGAHAQEAAPGVKHEQGIRVDHSVTINKSPAELYQFWRSFENLPRFMKHLESVTVQDETRSHWVATAPLGRTVEWDAEIINVQDNEMIAWRSLPGADVDSAGSVWFKRGPEGRGTEVHVSLSYQPPAGKLGAVVAKLCGEEPHMQIEEDLRHLKQLMETGEIPTTQGQSAGPRSRKGKMLQAVEGKLA